MGFKLPEYRPEPKRWDPDGPGSDTKDAMAFLGLGLPAIALVACIGAVVLLLIL